MAETIFGKPYIDKGEIREFDISKSDEEYGWCFQYENCLPWALKPGMIFHIMGSEYHRLIKGKNNLRVRLITNGKSNSS